MKVGEIYDDEREDSEHPEQRRNVDGEVFGFGRSLRRPRKEEPRRAFLGERTHVEGGRSFMRKFFWHGLSEEKGRIGSENDLDLGAGSLGIPV
jgi:hypothetical protein